MFLDKGFELKVGILTITIVCSQLSVDKIFHGPGTICRMRGKVKVNISYLNDGNGRNGNHKNREEYGACMAEGYKQVL